MSSSSFPATTNALSQLRFKTLADDYTRHWGTEKLFGQALAANSITEFLKSYKGEDRRRWFFSVASSEEKSSAVSCFFSSTSIPPTGSWEALPLAIADHAPEIEHFRFFVCRSPLSHVFAVLPSVHVGLVVQCRYIPLSAAESIGHSVFITRDKTASAGYRMSRWPPPEHSWKSGPTVYLDASITGAGHTIYLCGAGACKVYAGFDIS